MKIPVQGQNLARVMFALLPIELHQRWSQELNVPAPITSLEERKVIAVLPLELMGRPFIRADNVTTISMRSVKQAMPNQTTVMLELSARGIFHKSLSRKIRASARTRTREFLWSRPELPFHLQLVHHSLLWIVTNQLNKNFQSFDRAIFQEKSVKTPAKPKALENDTKPVSSNKLHNDQPNVPAQTDRHSTDFREVVKESIHIDTRRLSVKTSTKEVKQNVLKHRDSPRPGSSMIGSNGKSGTKGDINESLCVLVKLKEVPGYFSEASEAPRSSYEAKDARFNQISREAHRFSYDGREISRTSVDSQEQNKPASKLRDLLRLTLDSREGSLRSSNSDPKQNLMLKDFDKRNVTRASHSVVAQLMGLEAMPNLSFTAQEMMDLDKTDIRRDCDRIENLKKAEERHAEETTDNQNLKSVNLRNRQATHPVPISMKGSNSPRAFESPIVIMKPVKSDNKSGFDSSVVSLEGLSGLQKLRTSDPMDKKKASSLPL